VFRFEELTVFEKDKSLLAGESTRVFKLEKLTVFETDNFFVVGDFNTRRLSKEAEDFPTDFIEIFASNLLFFFLRALVRSLSNFLSSFLTVGLSRFSSNTVF
jgi:hypothetical protein